jgi:hypothetical protein
MYYILHVLAQLQEEEVPPNLPEDIVWEFYQLGYDEMREYLKQHELSQDVLDVLIDRVGVLLSDSDVGGDVEEAIFTAITEYSLDHGHWRDVATTDWFDDTVYPLMAETVGYLTTEVGDKDFENLIHFPTGIKENEKKQMEVNLNVLQERVFDGLQTAEEHYIEDLLHHYLDDAIQKPEESEETTERVDHAAL